MNNFLLARDKFMFKFHLRQPDLIIVLVDVLLNIIEGFKETGNLKHIYKNELDQACFSHDAVYSDSKNLAQRTVSDKILKDKAYGIALNTKYKGY